MKYFSGLLDNEDDPYGPTELGCLVRVMAIFVVAITGCLFMAPLPEPRAVTASIVWERGPCILPPGGTQCADGYVVSKCNEYNCHCEIHAVWTGRIAETALDHEVRHCIQDAAGVSDPNHERIGEWVGLR